MLAWGEGFEPPGLLHPAVFRTAALNQLRQPHKIGEEGGIRTLGPLFKATPDLAGRCIQPALPLPHSQSAGLEPTRGY